MEPETLQNTTDANRVGSTGGSAVAPDETSIARILWAIQLAERIQPGNCSHIGSNIFSTLIHAMRQMANDRLPKRLQIEKPNKQDLPRA